MFWPKTLDACYNSLKPLLNCKQLSGRRATVFFYFSTHAYFSEHCHKATICTTTACHVAVQYIMLYIRD